MIFEKNVIEFLLYIIIIIFNNEPYIYIYKTIKSRGGFLLEAIQKKTTAKNLKHFWSESFSGSWEEDFKALPPLTGQRLRRLMCLMI